MLNLAINKLIKVDNLRNCELPKLKYMIFDNNRIEGTLPRLESRQYPLLEYVRFKNNQLTDL